MTFYINPRSLICACTAAARSNGYDFEQNRFKPSDIFRRIKSFAARARDHCGGRVAVELLKGFYIMPGTGGKKIY